MKAYDKIVSYLVCLGVVMTPVFTCVIVNVITRPEMITVAVELPKRKPVVAIYEYGPDEEIPPPIRKFWYTDEPYIPYVYIAEIVEPVKVITSDDILCMAKNIYFESRTQSTKGQLAVGLVTLNRLESPYFPNTVCGVVYQHLQFSWYWDGLSDSPKHRRHWDNALLLASALLSSDGKIEDFTHGSDHYHADYVQPAWRLSMVKIVKIETHIFYRYHNRVF